MWKMWKKLSSRGEQGLREPKKTSEIKIQTTVTLYESLVKHIQQFADEHYDGDFSQGLRKIVRMWIEK